MESFKKRETKNMSETWSLLILIVPTATTLSLADTFINNRVESLDKAEIEGQVENLAIDLEDCKFLPTALKSEIQKSLSNTRTFLANS